MPTLEEERAVKAVQQASRRLFATQEVVRRKAEMDLRIQTPKAEKPLNLEDIVFPSTPPSTPGSF